MNITFRQIRYFIAVAEARSVSGGSNAVGISQSAVTDAIRTLEAETGVTLFTRHPRGVSLTREGHQFLRHAQSVIDVIADIQGSVRGAGQPVSGEVRVGVTPVVSGYLLSDVLARYRRSHPEVHVDIVEERRDFIDHMLVNGELDLAILVAPHSDGRTGIEQEVLLRSECRAWLAPTHRLAGEESLGLADIADGPLISLALDELDAMVDEVWSANTLRPRIGYRTSSVEAVRGLVGTGSGIALLPDLVYRPWSLDGDRVLAKRIREPLPTVDVTLAWRRLNRHREAAAMFLECARDLRDPRRG